MDEIRDPGQQLEHLPLYNASVGGAVARFWRKYATFDGRASRSEFWWWALVDTVVTSIFLVVAGAGGSAAGIQGVFLNTTSSVPYYVWNLVTLLPCVALTVRRLHDTNRGGLWVLIVAVPVVGVVVLAILALTEPDPAGARFDRQVLVGA